MKDILIPVSIPDDAQGPEWENKAIEYAKQALEERLRAEFEKERKQKCPTYDDIKCNKGFWITSDSKIGTYTSSEGIKLYNKNVFLTEKHTKRALAEAQISQLMPYYGGAITDEEWYDVMKTKYVVYRDKNRIDMTNACSHYEFVAFRTAEDRRRFMSREENVRLVKDYFMID